MWGCSYEVVVVLCWALQLWGCGGVAVVGLW